MHLLRHLLDLDPPHGYRISGEGAGGAAGFANGSAIVRLTPQGDGTDLSYEVEASVGGKIAQIGQRFIDQAAKKMADDFFARFAAAVAPSADASISPEAAPAAAAPEPQPTVSPAAATTAPQRQEPSPAEKLAKQMREAGMPLAPGPQEFAEMKRNLPIKFIVLALALAIIAAIAIFKH